MLTQPRAGSARRCVRYRTGDRVRRGRRRRARAAGPSCASRAGILGRLDDMLIVRGVNVFPSAHRGHRAPLPGGGRVPDRGVPRRASWTRCGCSSRSTATPAASPRDRCRRRCASTSASACEVVPVPRRQPAALRAQGPSRRPPHRSTAPSPDARYARPDRPPHVVDPALSAGLLVIDVGHASESPARRTTPTPHRPHRARAIARPSAASTTPSRALAFGLIRRVLRDPAPAEEVLQEVFWQVWQEAPGTIRAAAAPRRGSSCGPRPGQSISSGPSVEESRPS